MTRKIIVVLALLAWPAMCAAQFVLSPPNPSDLPQEPKRSLSRAFLEKEAARKIPVAQWLLMRWYRDYKGFMELDASDDSIAALLSAGITCPGSNAHLSLREALELKMVDPNSFKPRYKLQPVHHKNEDFVGVYEWLTKSDIPDILKAATLYQYKINSTSVKFQGAFMATADNKSWQRSNIERYGPLIGLKIKRATYCSFRDHYRKSAQHWIKKMHSKEHK